MGESFLEIEKKVMKIVKLRSERAKLQEEINTVVKEVIAWMQEEKKGRLSVPDYSVELKRMIRRDFDFDALDKLQEAGIITEEVMKKAYYERLLINSNKQMELVGNKFVWKKKDDK